MNTLCRRLGIDFPLIQAGMGGIAGPALAAATAEAGAGGVLALYRAPPPQVVALLAQTQRLTQRPFGVNLIPELVSPEALQAQILAVLESSGADVYFSFFGLPDGHACRLLHRAGRAFMVMVGDPAGAHAAAAQGADAVVLQGTEAGGHHLGEQRLDALLDTVMAAGLDTPVLVSGGIASGHRLRALVRRGAAGGLCGTLFVATEESEAHPEYKQRLLQASRQDTVVTDSFSQGWPGRRHRVLSNALTRPGQARLPSNFIASVPAGGRRHLLPRYSAMVPTAQTQGLVQEMAMYCGESVDGVADIVPARQRVRAFIDEYLAMPPATGSAGERERTPCD